MVPTFCRSDADQLDGHLSMTVANETAEIAADLDSNTAAAEESPQPKPRGNSPKRSRRRRKKTLDRQPPDPSVDDQAPNPADELRQQIEQKESVIQALTTQLEQAAERLDRIHRTGSDRQIRGPQLPDEFLGQQQELLEELQLAIRQMEESQPAMTLERIEREVCDVRDIISDFVHGTSSPGSSAARIRSNHTEGSQEQSLAAALSQAFSSPNAEPIDAPTNNESPGDAGPIAEINSAKEDMDDTNGLSSETMSLLRSMSPGSVSIKPEQPIELDRVEEADRSLMELIPVDLDEADRDELVAAVEDRDAMISVLIHKLRAAERRSQPAGRWSDLADVPEDMSDRLNELEQRLDETARLAELDLSLERARLAREAARLQTLEQQLRRREQAVAQSSADEKEGETKANRRWLRFVGRGRD